MSLAIRQIALVAADLAATVEPLQAVLGLGQGYEDPGVAAFGLRNLVLPVGNQFLEVVSPQQAGTTAGRLLQRRGDSGYMVILQTDDMDAARARIDRLGVRVIWQADLPDIRSVQLHPKDIGGAIVSLDQPDPPGAWRWGGPDWQARANPDGAQRILGARIEASDPQAMAQRWAEVLDLPAPSSGKGLFQITLGRETLTFAPAGARGEGLAGVTLGLRSPKAALAAARAPRLQADEAGVVLCGMRFDLLPHAG